MNGWGDKFRSMWCISQLAPSLALEFGALKRCPSPKGSPGITWIVLGALIDPIVPEASVERISQAHGASLCKRQMSPQCLVVEDEHM